MAESVLISIIGNPLPACFLPVLEAFECVPLNLRRMKYPTIQKALEAGLGQQSESEFTIVLQSSPEQFAQPDIELLLGRTIMSSIVCCYGPWCESAGRSAAHWPQAIRLPARIAASSIVRQLQKLARGHAPLSSLAAPEEAFSFRTDTWPLKTTEHTTRSGFKQLAAAVISGDTALRKTIVQLCQSFGMAAVAYPRLVANPSSGSFGLSAPPEIVFMDLDDHDSLERQAESTRLLSTFPTAFRVGFTWTPGRDFRLAEGGQLHRIIAKMDLLNGVVDAMQQFSS